MLQFSVCVAPLPVIEQPALAVLHGSAAPLGSRSLTVTSVAVPGPLLVTTIVNVAVSPAWIVAVSGVLAIDSTGVWQVIWPEPLPWLALLATTLAVLFMSAQLAR